jgi:hypothetical protein
LENTTDIIGYAYNRIGHAAGNASYDLEIDAVNKVIIFTLNEELM